MKHARRFWARVDIAGPHECWEWRGFCSDGYGRLNPESYGESMAHRYAFRQRIGEIPARISVLHRCDNRRCCNPAHLFLGTLQDNMDDRNMKGRQARGERQWAAILTEENVRDIRRRRSSGERAKDLAAEFGVHPTTISNLSNGWTWQHVEREACHG